MTIRRGTKVTVMNIKKTSIANETLSQFESQFINYIPSRYRSLKAHWVYRVSEIVLKSVIILYNKVLKSVIIYSGADS